MRTQPTDFHAPNTLYKVVSDHQWQTSQGKSTLTLGEIDTDFIHLDSKEQVQKVLATFWSNTSAWVLTMQTNALHGTLVHEKNPGGNTRYYHLYAGHIPMQAVLHATWKPVGK